MSGNQGLSTRLAVAVMAAAAPSASSRALRASRNRKVFSWRSLAIELSASVAWPLAKNSVCSLPKAISACWRDLLYVSVMVWILIGMVATAMSN
jgi:hypothetical protein